MSEGFNCPSCGDDWRGKEGAARPAHLALLEESSARPPAKPRLVSTAGRAVPVVNRQNDSVPSGWMARLEAARMTAGASVEGGAGQPPPMPSKPSSSAPRPSQPPPLRPKAVSAPSPRPAHLLVAQLEAEERRLREQEQSRLQQLFEAEPKSEIAAASLDLPRAPKKKKRIPDAVLFGLLAIAVLGGLAAVFMAVQKEPPPEVVIDPVLAKQAADKKKAFEALEKGHKLSLEGTGKAQEALAAYRVALQFAPKMARAERGMAVVYAGLDDDENAVTHYRRYLELRPTAKDAGEVRKIIKAYERATKKRK